MTDEPKPGTPLADHAADINARLKELEEERRRVLERPLEPELDPA